MAKKMFKNKRFFFLAREIFKWNPRINLVKLSKKPSCNLTFTHMRFLQCVLASILPTFTVKKGVEFPSKFCPKSTLFVYSDLLFWLSTSKGPTLWPNLNTFFAYGLAIVHFGFWVWDRNPNIHSKSARILLGNSTRFLIVFYEQLFHTSVYRCS